MYESFLYISPAVSDCGRALRKKRGSTPVGGNPSRGSFISIYLPIKGIGDKAFRFAGNGTVWVILQRNYTISLVAKWIFIFLFLFDNEFGKLRGKESCANKYLPSPQFHSRFLLINFLFNDPANGPTCEMVGYYSASSHNSQKLLPKPIENKLDTPLKRIGLHPPSE
jgi:hypothetical protein